MTLLNSGPILLMTGLLPAMTLQSTTQGRAFLWIQAEQGAMMVKGVVATMKGVMMTLSNHRRKGLSVAPVARMTTASTMVGFV